MTIQDLQKLIEDGLKAHKKGEFELANRCYSKVLQKAPDRADAWHLAGVLAHTQGHISLALTHIKEALRLESEFPEALNALGNILKEQRKFDDSLNAYNRAIEINDKLAETYANRGELYRCTGDLKKAEDDCRKSIFLNPQLSVAHGNLAAVLMDNKDWVSAELSLREAIRLTPGKHEFLVNLSETLIKLNELEEALSVAQNAVDLCPESSHALNALGNVYYALSDYELAEESYQNALRLAPDNPDVHNNLGNVWAKQNRLVDAIKSFRMGLSLVPERPDVLANLGGVLQAQGRSDEALEILDRALQLDPEYADGHWNRALARLITGDLVGGFSDYEWRFRLPDYEVKQNDAPLWEGQPLKTKSILITPEQGYGDAINFIRYAASLSGLGAEVVVETHEPLVRLFEGVENVVKVVVAGRHAVKTDYHIPIMSLPHRFGTTIETIPINIPYLPAGVMNDFRLGANGERKIGVAWAGNPKHKHRWAENRIIPPSCLRPLFELSKIDWFSLQIENDQNKDVAFPSGNNLFDIRDQIKDFSDTASIINELDLVISVDTSVAHLAGAIGKPVWTLLSFAADWRWLLNREDSPWYPTMKLFRQPFPGDWSGVVKKVREELEKFS